MSKTHDLKIYPRYFDEIVSGKKTWELRKNDRGFKTGDILHLREWLPQNQVYTSKSVNVEVLGVWGSNNLHIRLPDGYVLMSIRVVEGDGNAAHHGC